MAEEEDTIPVEEMVLSLVDQTGSINTSDVAKKLNVDHQVIVGTVKSLQSLGSGNVRSYWVRRGECKARWKGCFCRLLSQNNSSLNGGS